MPRPAERPALAHRLALASRTPVRFTAGVTTVAATSARACAAPYSGAWHRALGALNIGFMVPALRAGLGPLLVTPIGGYLMVLVTRGRRSGQARYAPLDYAIVEGRVYCLAGFGERTQWLRNARVDPHVELILPGRRLRGIAGEVTDAAERSKAARAVLRAGGFAGLLAGCDPWHASDATIGRCLEGIPLVRIEPATPLRPGPFDPGGRGWIPTQAALALAAIGALRVVRRRLGSSRRVAAAPADGAPG